MRMLAAVHMRCSLLDQSRLPSHSIPKYSSHCCSSARGQASFDFHAAGTGYWRTFVVKPACGAKYVRSGLPKTRCDGGIVGVVVGTHLWLCVLVHALRFFEYVREWTGPILKFATRKHRLWSVIAYRSRRERRGAGGCSQLAYDKIRYGICLVGRAPSPQRGSSALARARGRRTTQSL